MLDLSILIPARNEEFLGRTVQDLLEHAKSNYEIIVILDGYMPNPGLPKSERIIVIYNPVAVGQRAATNQGAKIARGKYLMKVDAHCAFDDGFDIKMLEAFKKLDDNVTMIPAMRNFHVFDWVCSKCGSRWYMGHTPRKCLLPDGETLNTSCDSTEFFKDVVWKPKPSPNSFSFRFDRTMHFQYWGALAKRPENLKGADTNDGGNDPQLRETLSIQGSAFMLTKERYLTLDICSEDFNSWGQQGVEVACKTWLSGGRVISNLNTWYAHMFRTKGGDFGFPYPNPQDKINENREKSRELFTKDKWPLAIHTFQWLLDKFNPPDWEVKKGMIYFTDNQLDEKIAKPVRDRLAIVSKEKKIDIVSSSLKKMDFGVKNIHYPSLRRGYSAMFKQILGALQNSKADIIFFVEHDVLYHPSHFDFNPTDQKTFYYNQNVWFLRATDGHALHYDVNQVSGICVYRDTAIAHYKERLALVEQKEKELSPDEFNSWIRHMGFEPFTHNRVQWKTVFSVDTWKSEFPNIDIKHGANLTGQRWNKDQYRNQNLLINWQETDDSIEGWGKTSEIIKIIE